MDCGVGRGFLGDEWRISVSTPKNGGCRFSGMWRRTGAGDFLPFFFYGY
jgi:hypothetical protein